ncbi:DUF72 domain-containing protein [candidate division WOR-3 bacterium]|uniref:DUF72 domain-containing protein n=1 Tax=candidate division WOR-3 bacterium TaxID=2052148 RepID=A0A660SFV6_UNCW3|nr:MAG: DUF72 domain-containing protein [candidate division WOR-3 bacterium]
MATKIGCCGFPVARTKYYSTFPVVEIQSIFYNLPQIKTVVRWREEAPEDFEFVIKASQFITHDPKSPTYRKARIPKEVDLTQLGSFRWNRSTQFVWQYLKEIAQILRCRVIIFQTPRSFTPTEENINSLKEFFHQIDRAGLILGWESRGEWPNLKGLLSELDLIDVVDPFLRRPVHGMIGYYRIHGGKGYRKKFSANELSYLKKLIKKNSYVMFNNISMFEDALSFLGMLG